MCGDEEVMRYVGNGQPLSRGESWRSLAMMLRRVIIFCLFFFNSSDFSLPN